MLAWCEMLTSTSSGRQVCDRLAVSVITAEEARVVPSRGCPTSAITSSTFSILTLGCGHIWVCRAITLLTRDAGNRLLVSRLTTVSARLRLQLKPYERMYTYVHLHYTYVQTHTHTIGICMCGLPIHVTANFLISLGWHIYMATLIRCKSI